MAPCGLVLTTLATCASSMQQRVGHPRHPEAPNIMLEQGSATLADQLLQKGMKMTYPRSLSEITAESEFSCQQASWKPKIGVEIANVSGETLCSNGKVLPQVYLFGAMKAGTSSIARDLSGLGVSPIDGVTKEFHFFAHKFDTSVAATSSSQQKWLDTMPSCPSADSGEHKLLADYTPQMHYVPAPAGWRHLEPTPTANFTLPHTLSSFYTKSEKERLVMVASFREPLARMQSAWYASQLCENKCICPWCRHSSFLESLQVQLKEFNNATSPGMSDWFWASHYGHLVHEWLQNFPADRFVFVPLGLYSKKGIEPLCEAVAEKSGFQLACKPAPSTDDAESPPGEAAHEWHTEHPPLEEEVPEDLRTAYKEMLSHSKQTLVAELVEAQHLGATLVGYLPAKADAVSVEKWLDENW